MQNSLKFIQVDVDNTLFRGYHSNRTQDRYTERQTLRPTYIHTHRHIDGKEIDVHTDGNAGLLLIVI